MGLISLFSVKVAKKMWNFADFPVKKRNSPLCLEDGAKEIGSSNFTQNVRMAVANRLRMLASKIDHKTHFEWPGISIECPEALEEIRKINLD